MRYTLEGVKKKVGILDKHRLENDSAADYRGLIASMASERDSNTSTTLSKPAILKRPFILRGREHTANFALLSRNVFATIRIERNPALLM